MSPRVDPGFSTDPYYFIGPRRCSLLYAIRAVCTREDRNPVAGETISYAGRTVPVVAVTPSPVFPGRNSVTFMLDGALCRVMGARSCGLVRDRP